MQVYEYRVVPAPMRADRTSRTVSRTANYTSKLEHVLNEQGLEGWEYLRAETMQVEVMEGRRNRALETKSVLVFRRALNLQETPALEPAASEIAFHGEIDLAGAGEIEGTVLDDPRYS